MEDSVDVWSGGTDAPLSREVDMFHEQLHVKRSLFPKIVAGLAKIPMATHPEYTSWTLSAMLSAPKGLSQQRHVNVIGNAMRTSRRGACVEAAERMRQAAQWLKSFRGAEESVLQNVWRVSVEPDDAHSRAQDEAETLFP